ncbi:unnamed protein product [Adineta steineri]|uniref:Uncharacterized protein n=2 Tax=Adineta steineri TaxID=433720 RepID=A0A815PTC3_9BILA|nr:unnamed protein product [Adineta steineri]CAF1451508.1 unnamed protein product [Adineta steineri]CAF1453064.1 unnamed protein product [Adineta steineri]CAF1620936.1 unnamed protein product [Adineta steineri]CAF3751984.1 unnamed protein product [Adineta steineri]
MGCSYSTLNRIETEQRFKPDDILYLTQSWNMIKAHEFQKFTQQILIRTINQSPSFRKLCMSKVNVDGNNYDFGQHDSCLRDDKSWQMGLPDYSLQVIYTVDELLSIISNKNHSKIQFESFNLIEKDMFIGNETLLIIKQNILEMLREQLPILNYNFTIDVERAWNKFLTFIIEYMSKNK